MKLNIGGTKPTQTKPATSLQEKTSGHKFTLPNQSKPAQTSSPEVASKPKGLNFGNVKSTAKSSSENVVAIQPVESKSNGVAEISDERFNIVAGAEAGLDIESAEKFRDMLTMLSENIDNEGELQNVLKGTLTYLQENPEVESILLPEDRAIFVRAARKSYGITLVAKTTRKAKTTKSAKAVDDLMDELADLDFAL